MSKSANKPDAAKFAEWLRSIPPGVEEGKDIKVAVTISLNPEEWQIYARSASHYGETIDETISDILRAESCEYLNCGFKTKEMMSAEREAEFVATLTEPK